MTENWKERNVFVRGRSALLVVLLAGSGLLCEPICATAAGFGGGHSGGFGGAGFSGGHGPGFYAGPGHSARGVVGGHVKGRNASGRISQPGGLQPQIVSRAGMNRQLILPSDRNDRAYHGGGGDRRGGFGNPRMVNRDRYGNAYGLGLGGGYGSGTYGAGYGYGAGGPSASYGYNGSVPVEPGVAPYAPPKIIEIGAANLASSRSQASYTGELRSGRSARAIVTYGTSLGSQASVGPQPYNYAGGQDLFSPRVVRARVPKG